MWCLLEYINDYFIDYSVGPVATGYLLGLRRNLVGSHLTKKPHQDYAPNKMVRKLTCQRFLSMWLDDWWGQEESSWETLAPQHPSQMSRIVLLVLWDEVWMPRSAHPHTSCWTRGVQCTCCRWLWMWFSSLLPPQSFASGLYLQQADRALSKHFGHQHFPSVRIFVWVRRGGTEAKAFNEERLQQNLKFCMARSWVGIWAGDSSKKVYLIFLNTWMMLLWKVPVSSLTRSHVG